MLRKKPTQDRSKKRVEIIVNAATRVFAEDGFAEATVERVAERAGVSIGSLYQFFPNKRALFDAVWEKYFGEIRALVDGFMSDDHLRETSWEQLLDDSIDALFVFHRESPGFRALFNSLQLSPELLAADEALGRDIARQLEKVLGRFTTADKKQRELIAIVVVETLSAMLLRGARHPRARASALMAETKVLLRRYLAPYADKT